MPAYQEINIQKQMSDEFYKKCVIYIKSNNLTFAEFAERVGIEKYMLRKILDRRIKMYCPSTTLEKIGKTIYKEM